MPARIKAHKLLALSAFALSATLFHATTLRAATTAADTAAAVSTSADTAAPAADATAVAEPQTAAPAAAPAPAAPAAPPTWSVGPIDFSGLVDGYYSFNANHPNPNTNQLRNFDYDANSFSLNMIKLSLSHTADPVGFRVDLGFGKAFSIFNGLQGTPTVCLYACPAPTGDSINDTHLEQAYVSWVPAKGKGFEADFGQFVTSAGAEVIETMNNWNYSRSILFAYMIPYYHMGLRTSYPITKKETIGFQVVNGWNNITDNNAGKTIGLTSLYTAPKYNWAVNYYVGPENTGTDKGYRNLIDTTLNLTPTAKSLAKWTAYLNYDYVQNRNATTTNSINYTKSSLYHQQGIAVAAHYQATGTIAFAGRYEYIADESGQITGHTKAGLDEFTLTGEYKMAAGLLGRLEYRRDSTDNNFFVKGTSKLVKAQSTLELGIVAFFGPKR
jgi:hypothetical protein